MLRSARSAVLHVYCYELNRFLTCKPSYIYDFPLELEKQSNFSELSLWGSYNRLEQKYFIYLSIF